MDRWKAPFPSRPKRALQRNLLGGGNFSSHKRQKECCQEDQERWTAVETREHSDPERQFLLHREKNPEDREDQR